MSEWYKKKADGNLTREEKKAVSFYCQVQGVDKYAVKKFEFRRKANGDLVVEGDE